MYRMNLLVLSRCISLCFTSYFSASSSIIIVLLPFRFHMDRCLTLLGISDQFHHKLYCDYSEPDFLCKPDVAQYERAMKLAGAAEHRCCYLIDDSPANIVAANKLGWKTVHITGMNDVKAGLGGYNVARVHDLPHVLPFLYNDVVHDDSHIKNNNKQPS